MRFTELQNGRPQILCGVQDGLFYDAVDLAPCKDVLAALRVSDLHAFILVPAGYYLELPTAYWFGPWAMDCAEQGVFVAPDLVDDRAKEMVGYGLYVEAAAMTAVRERSASQPVDDRPRAEKLGRLRLGKQADLTLGMPKDMLTERECQTQAEETKALEALEAILREGDRKQLTRAIIKGRLNETFALSDKGFNRIWSKGTELYPQWKRGGRKPNPHPN